MAGNKRTGPRILTGEYLPLSIYSDGFASLPVRLQLLIAARQSGERACFLSRTKMAKILGCSPDALKKAIQRLRENGKVESVSWTEGDRRFTGLRCMVDVTDKVIDGLNLIAPNRIYCRPEDRPKVESEIRARLDERKVAPVVYPFHDGTEEILEGLEAQGHWVALYRLWETEGFEELIDWTRAETRAWWLSLISNMRMNDARWVTSIDDRDLLVQVGLLNAADHIQRKVEGGRWAGKRNPAGLFCRILQTLDRPDDEFAIVDPGDVAADMATLSGCSLITAKQALTDTGG